MLFKILFTNIYLVMLSAYDAVLASTITLLKGLYLAYT